MKYSVWIAGKAYTVEIVEDREGKKFFWEGEPVCVDIDSRESGASIVVDGKPYEVFLRRDGESLDIQIENSILKTRVCRGTGRREQPGSSAGGLGEEVIFAPMPGLVVSLRVGRDQEVGMGDPLLILEAMKMENELRSPVRGRIKDIFVEENTKVEKGTRLLAIEV